MNRRKILIPVAVLVVIAIIVTLVLVSRQGSDGVLSGTVEATDAQLGFTSPGRIDTILVQEGDRVKAGQELARLDQSDLHARRQQAQAALEAARAMLQEMQTGSRPEDIRSAQEGARAADERFLDAQRDQERVQRLFSGGAVSQEQLDKAQTAFQVAQAQRDQAHQNLQLVQTGPRRERIEAQQAAVAQAQAAVRQMDVALDNSVITAPFDGVVTVRDREPGETVGAGAPVLTVMDEGDRWVRIYIPETQVGAVHLGEPASISTDTYKGKTYSGAVSFIASEAEFTPRNVQTAEERVKLVYAVKVRITGDPGLELKPGMPADVRLQQTQAAGRPGGR